MRERRSRAWYGIDVPIYPGGDRWQNAAGKRYRYDGGWYERK